jgi:benzoate-CoA ligase
MPRVVLPDRFNVATWFVDRNVEEGRGDSVAIECGEERVSYRQLLERVNRAGDALRALDVRVEQRVLLLLLDSPSFAYSFFGALKIGAVAIPVNSLLKSSDYEYLLNDSRAVVAVVSDSLLPQIQAIPRHRLRYLREIVVAGDAPEVTLSLARLMEWASPELEPEPTRKDDVAFWLYSSGSTGAPKGCVHLHHDMVVCAEAYAKGILGISARDRCFSASKLFFAYGLGNGLYFPFSVGGTTILSPGLTNPANVLDVIARHRPTLFFAVPTIYAAMLNWRAEGQDADLSSIRYGISAGEALPAVIYHRFRERFGVEILDAIGSTECLHMFIASRPGAVRPGSSGQIIPGFDARIVDDNGQAVPTGEIGNLIVRSDATCAYYWNQHDTSKEMIQGHWIRTGDKYRQDEEGYFWYAGRSDDMLKVSGCWVSPVEIESALAEHPGVREVAVIGCQDQQQLLRPLAFVVLQPDRQPGETTTRELQEFVTAKLAPHKKPRWIEYLPELPKTATGKIQRFKLREMVRHKS